MDNHKDKQEHSLVDDQTANQTRRQIIRGMAATVPVMLTLSNAHAQAVASNLRCIGTPPPDPGCQPAATNPPIRDLSTTPEYSGNLNGYFDYGDGTAVYEGPLNNEYCPVYIDSNGIITDASGGVPVTASCFNSFA